MEIKEIAEKLKEELPEFIWKVGSYNKSIIHGYYFVNHFFINNNEIFIECCPPLFYKTYYEVANIKENYESWVENHEDGFLINSERDLHLFITAAQVWVIKCGALKESMRYDKQLIFIHPDLCEYHVPKFLEDFDYIYTNPDDEDQRIGVMSARKWDFSKEELINTIEDNTGCSFLLWPLKDLDELLLEEDIDKKFFEDFFKEHPDAKNIKEIYNTDWD